MISDVRSFFYNYLHTIVGRAAGASVIGFVSVILLVRVLGADGYGVYVLFISVASIIAILTGWTSGSIVRFGREEFITEGSVKKTFWANYTILAPVFALCFLLIFVFRATLGDYIGVPAGYYYLIFAFLLAGNLSERIPVAFQAVGKMKHYSYLPLAVSGTFLVALMVVYFGAFSLPVEYLIGLFIAGHVFAVLLGAWLVRKYITPVTFSREWIRKCLGYSWPMAFGGMSQQIVHNVDQLVIGGFMAVAFVGVYNVAYRMQEYLVMVPLLSGALMFPLMTSLLVTREGDKIARYIRVYAPQIVFFWTVFLSFFMLFGREIFLIFGSEYVGAAFPFSILLVGVTLRVFPIIESPILSSYGLIKEMAALVVIMSLINLGLDFALIPRMGIPGAAIATTVAFAFSAFARTWIVRRKLAIDNFRSYPWMFPIVGSFAGAVLIDSLPFRAACLLIVLAVSFIVARRSSVFNAESLAIVDAIEMPAALRGLIKRVYSLLV